MCACVGAREMPTAFEIFSWTEVTWVGYAMTRTEGDVSVRRLGMTMEMIDNFWYSLGIVLGNLSDEHVENMLVSKGVSDSEIDEARRLLRKMAATLYRQENKK